MWPQTTSLSCPFLQAVAGVKGTGRPGVRVGEQGAIPKATQPARERARAGQAAQCPCREGHLEVGLAEAWGLGPVEEAPAAFEGPVPRPRAGKEGPSALWGLQSQGS